MAPSATSRRGETPSGRWWRTWSRPRRRERREAEAPGGGTKPVRPVTDILPSQMDASGALRQAMEVPAEGRPPKADAAALATSDAQTLFTPILEELAEFEGRLEAAGAPHLGPTAAAA